MQVRTLHRERHSSSLDTPEFSLMTVAEGKWAPSSLHPGGSGKEVQGLIYSIISSKLHALLTWLQDWKVSKRRPQVVVFQVPEPNVPRLYGEPGCSREPHQHCFPAGVVRRELQVRLQGLFPGHEIIWEQDFEPVNSPGALKKEVLFFRSPKLAKLWHLLFHCPFLSFLILNPRSFLVPPRSTMNPLLPPFCRILGGLLIFSSLYHLFDGRATERRSRTVLNKTQLTKCSPNHTLA